ncbi:MAG: GGDEF domain-containing protein [Bacilli bacterium]|nr:GGDEF domain-containing protein [Bacilli bacterium]
MNYLFAYFVRYFILICAASVLYVTSIQRFKSHKRISICMILVISFALLLSVANIFEDIGKNYCIVPLTTICAWLGYVLRPVLVYLFIIMSGVKFTKKQMLLSLIPLAVNFVIFCGAFIPHVNQYIFLFDLSEDTTHLVFAGAPLRFSSHLTALFYLIWVVYLSIARLRSKHFFHAIGSLVCATFIVLAVLIETFLNDDADVYLLNSTVAVTALEYYIFLYTEQTQVDSLTGLFNRETLFMDIEKMGRSITGIIEFDMNGLKYLNDNFGHAEGDKGLKTIAEIAKKAAKRNMYPYRVGGDEFAVLAINCSEEDIKEAIKLFTEELSKTSYYCSVGYAYRGNNDMTFSELNKKAEKEMYLAKDEFYKNSPFERRIIK